MSWIERPPCADDPGSWCATIFNLTNSAVIARVADPVINAGLKILLILVLALLARYLLHRLINRIVAGATSERVSRLARRMPSTPSPAVSPHSDSPRSVQRARTIGSVLRSISSTIVLVIAAIMILAEFGVDLGPILASAGIVGVAVGFGAQNLVKDFLSGMFMLLEDQYGVGDIIDTGNANGVVEAVGLRITTLRDVGGTVWYVRNGEILRVGNKSQGYAVAVVDIPLAHNADVAEATELAARVAVERVAEDDIKDSVIDEVKMLGVERVVAEGMTLRLTVKCKPGQQFAVQRALNGAITDAFDEADIPRPGMAPNGPPPAR